MRRELSTTTKRLALNLAYVLPMAGALGVPPALAAPDQDVALSMANRTTVQGAKSASVEVRVPSEATLSAVWGDDNPDLHVDGTGLMPGIVLVKDVPDRSGPYLVAVRAPRDSLCDGSDCPLAEVVRAPGFDEDARGYVIPSGRYILYLLAYGSPVSVTLTLDGLEGNRTIEPDGPAHLSGYEMRPRLAVPGQSLYWDGAYRDMDGPGMLLLYSTIVSRYVLNTDEEHCVYDGEPAAPTAYVPTCPGASRANFSWTWAGDQTWRSQTISLDEVQEAHGLARWYVATHPVEHSTAVALWLTYA
jgi:hypothetical protein